MVSVSYLKSDVCKSWGGQGASGQILKENFGILAALKHQGGRGWH